MSLTDTHAEAEPTMPGPFGGMSPAEAAAKRWEKEHHDLAEALESFEEAMQNPKAMIGVLVNAALGRGRWKKLPIDKQLAALIKANEYVNGRPRQMNEEGNDEGSGFLVGMAPEEATDGANLPRLPSQVT